ncbi:hypothetical protein E2C01_018910 [Portunus trituberculatus]|uniref:Uncharacterized protein n=1 Tax=Portunus trituberculatus TaxID=210409 RepID=A0A5B7DXM8_PORTR|nr:hypothetical protein [Portunus trituberculatus]
MDQDRLSALGFLCIETDHANRVDITLLWMYDCPSWPPTAYKRSDSTATPTPHLRLLIGATIRHSHVVGSNLSTEAMASPLHQPPTENTIKFFSAVMLSELISNAKEVPAGMGVSKGPNAKAIRWMQLLL